MRPQHATARPPTAGGQPGADALPRLDLDRPGVREHLRAGEPVAGDVQGRRVPDQGRAGSAEDDADRRALGDLPAAGPGLRQRPAFAGRSGPGADVRHQARQREVKPHHAAAPGLPARRCSFRAPKCQRSVPCSVPASVSVRSTRTVCAKAAIATPRRSPAGRRWATTSACTSWNPCCPRARRHACDETDRRSARTPRPRAASARRSSGRSRLEPRRPLRSAPSRIPAATRRGARRARRTRRRAARAADASLRRPAPSSRPGQFPGRPHRGRRRRSGRRRAARSARGSRTRRGAGDTARLPRSVRDDHRLPRDPGRRDRRRRLRAAAGSVRSRRGVRSAAAVRARSGERARTRRRVGRAPAPPARVPLRPASHLGRDRGDAGELPQAPGGGGMTTNVEAGEPDRTAGDWTTLVSAETLAAALGDPQLVLVDARAMLSDPDAGERAWRESHLPGARHVHLERELSDHAKPAALGRHPLPEPAAFAATLARLGVRAESQVVVYDGGDGAMAAARFWWLLRLAGHRRVAVLDGGIARWKALDLPLDAGDVPPAHAPMRDLAFDATRIVDTAGVQARLGDAPGWLIDVRGAERFRGDVEPIDPVAGHIPGARNRPLSANTRDGVSKPPHALRAEFETLLAGTAPSDVVLHCGSGVTACQTLLAMEHAGLSGARIYAPSWSGWIADRSRPVATGD